MNWKPVVGYEGAYEVSDTGQVRSLDRIVYSTQGRKYFKPGRVLKTNTPGNRYPRATLRLNGKTTPKHVHRIVAEAFIPNPEGLPVVRHLNDIPDDNRVENLAWGTHYDNMRDLFDREGHHNSNKTHCKRGHQFTEENTYFTPNKGRVCKICRDARVKGHHEKYANTEPKEHGTMTAYKVNKCRCEPCKKANTDYCRAARERRKARETLNATLRKVN